MHASSGRWALRLATVALIVGVLVYVPCRIFNSESFVRYRQLKRQDEALARDNESVARKNDAMRREIRRLQTDIAAVGTVARDELGMVGPGEIVFQIEQIDRWLAPAKTTMGGTEAPEDPDSRPDEGTGSQAGGSQ
ncbi:MAG: septum formation initiator family protein [Pseudomonadota bacterium]